MFFFFKNASEIHTLLSIINDHKKEPKNVLLLAYFFRFKFLLIAMPIVFIREPNFKLANYLNL